MAIIRPDDLPAAGSVANTVALVVDSGSAVEKATPLQVVDAAIPLASQAEAEAGVNNTKRVTPLRVKQAIAALWATVSTFIALGVGAVPRGIQDKLRDTVSAFDFIPPDKHASILAGLNTDDVAAYLQAALNTGMPVMLPPTGVMWIASTLLVPSNGGFVGSYGCTIKAKANFGNNPLIRNITPNPTTNAERDTNITLAGVRLDGNKANNATATEFSHGVRLNAVDGVLTEVWAVDCKGDGVIFSYARAEDGSDADYAIGCRDMSGRIRAESCARQGVAITCAEAFDLSVFARNIDLIGFDIEPDHAPSFVRNGKVWVEAIECGQAGSGTRGGVLVHGTNSDTTGRADVSGLIVDATILNCEGTAGIMWRDVIDVLFRFTVKGQTGHGVYGIEAAFAPSEVTLEGTVRNVTADGLLSRNTGDIINGSLDVTDAVGVGANIQGAGGGSLHVRSYSAGQQGIALASTNNMIFPDSEIIDSSQSGVFISNSSGNRFPGLRSTGSVGGWGFQENGSANNNRATNARLASNSSGAASLLGATSLVVSEDLIGKATYDAPSIPAAGTATTTVAVTGAAIGDQVTVTFGVSLAGLIATAYVSAANTVTIVLQNPTGGAIDLASTTVKAFVTPAVIA